VGGIAVIGNLARDTIDGGEPRVGGAPYHAARGLRLLGGDSRIVARCADADRRSLVPPLSALGVPVTWLPAPRTTAFEIQNDGEEREMTVGALTIDLLSYQTFLLLLGSFFVPLFGVLLADWLAAGSHYSVQDVFGGPAVRPGMIGAWIAGFAAYQWLYPTGPHWWVDLVEKLDPPDWSIGASLPSFAVSLALGLVIAAAGKRRF